MFVYPPPQPCSPVEGRFIEAGSVPTFFSTVFTESKILSGQQYVLNKPLLNEGRIEGEMNERQGHSKKMHVYSLINAQEITSLG